MQLVQHLNSIPVAMRVIISGTPIQVRRCSSARATRNSRRRSQNIRPPPHCEPKPAQHEVK